MTKAKIQAEVDEIDVDNVFTSPDPDMKKSFDITEYFGEKIEKIQSLKCGDAKKDSRNLNLSKRLSEETPKGNASPVDFSGIKRIFAQATPSFNI